MRGHRRHSCCRRLHERRDDIPPLVRQCTRRLARRTGRWIETIPSAVMEALVGYPWPGYIRELQNVIERAVILSPGSSLQVPLGDLEIRDQKPDVEGRGSRRGEKPAAEDGPLTSDLRPPTSTLTLAHAEREHILVALRETGWVVSGAKGAAARLGMKRSTLQKKMKSLGIFRPE